jgi:hypothetical protein
LNRSRIEYFNIIKKTIGGGLTGYTKLSDVTSFPISGKELFHNIFLHIGI